LKLDFGDQMDCPCDRAFVLAVADVGDGPGLAYSYRLSELGVGNVIDAVLIVSPEQLVPRI